MFRWGGMFAPDESGRARMFRWGGMFAPDEHSIERAGAGERMWDDGPMIFEVHIEVAHRAGVADPQGATIERSLPALGFDGVRDVHVGKSIRFTLEAADEASARSEVEDMCSRFLSNPVIEDTEIHLRAAAPA